MRDTLRRAADAVVCAIEDLDDWAQPGGRPGQYLVDLVAEAAAVHVLLDAGLGVISEEAGVVDAGSGVVVVLDPIDGSHNAVRGIPCFGTSLCAVDAAGPWVALVHDHVRGARYEAIRDGVATRDGVAIATSSCTSLGAATVALSGHPPRRLGWAADRAWGAAAIELCAVADGTFDAFVDTDRDAHGPWDHLAGLLVCRQAGAAVGELLGRDLDSTLWSDRRSPLAAATPELLAEIEAALETGLPGRQRTLSHSRRSSPAGSSWTPGASPPKRLVARRSTS